MIVKTKEFSIRELPPGENKTALEQLLKRYREEKKNIALLTFDGEMPSKPVNGFDIDITFTGGKKFKLASSTATNDCFESHLYFASKYLNDAGQLSGGDIDGTWLLYDLPNKNGKSAWIGITTGDFRYTVFTTGIKIGDESKEIFAIVEANQESICPTPEEARPNSKKKNPTSKERKKTGKSAGPIKIIIGYTTEAVSRYGLDAINAYVETFRDDITLYRSIDSAGAQ